MPMGLPMPENYEEVGVFQRGGGELGLRRGLVPLEIGDGPALPEVKLAFDVAVESRAGPASADGVNGIPFAGGGVGNFRQQADMRNHGNWAAGC